MKLHPTEIYIERDPFKKIFWAVTRIADDIFICQAKSLYAVKARMEEHIEKQSHIRINKFVTRSIEQFGLEFPGEKVPWTIESPNALTISPDMDVYDRYVFSTLYTGQKVAKQILMFYPAPPLRVVGHSASFNEIAYGVYYLILRSINKITDQEASVIMPAKSYEQLISHSSSHVYEEAEATTSFIASLSTNDINYLRSRGFALPWNGFSVHEQIKRGWIKLEK